MEDPKHKGIDLKEIYEVQEPLPPPKIIGYASRVLDDDSRYDANGVEIIEAKPIADDSQPVEITPAPAQTEVLEDDSESAKRRGRR